MRLCCVGQPTCLVTGTSGYVGSKVKVALQRRGWRVVELTRRPCPDATTLEFQLGQELSPSELAGAKALVHCAYDFKELSWDAIYSANVVGSEKLFRVAREAKIERMVHISSISAYEGCRSLYGKAKLATEKIAQDLGAIVIRPGLIWGDLPGAMFSRLVKQVDMARVLPLFGGGSQIQYLVHDQDLARFICCCVEGTVARPAVPVTVAHEQPWTFRQILEEIARAKRKRLSFLAVPWRLAWAGLKCGEACGVRLDFRSDSLLSLMYQNPNPSLALQRELGVDCRPFGMVPASLR